MAVHNTSSYQWDDPLFFDEQLSDEERLVRDSVRDFAQDVLQPQVMATFRDESFNPALMLTFGKNGLLGATLKGYGCAGINQVAYGLMMRELERVDSGYRSIVSVQSSLAMYAIYAFGSEAQKQAYLPKMARGECIGCFGLTEANHGSDPAGMETTATTVAGGYRLKGTKLWITNAPIADIFIVWARKDKDKIQGYILEKNSKGLSSPLMHGKMSLRVSLTGEIVMDDVFVTQEHELPDAQGLAAALRCLDNARYGIAWGALGAAEFCWHTARQYVLDRQQFGHPLAANQLIQQKLANMQTSITLGLQSCLRLGRLKENDRAETPMISMLKRYSTLTALDVAREARDMLGGNGIMEDFNVMRHMVNLETVKTYEGTADIQALILGKAQTGIQAFKPLG